MDKCQWEFEWICSWDEVWNEDFVSRWNHLMEESQNAHVYFRSEIVRAWHETYKQFRDIHPRFFIARHDNFEVFFPLVIDKRGWKDGWQNVLYPAGQNEFDYHDPIERKSLPEDLKVSFWKDCKKEVLALKDRIDIVDFPRIRCNGVNKCEGMFKKVAQAPFIDLLQFGAYDDYLLKLPKQMRQELRRQPRRLKELGALELNKIDDVDEALSILPIIEKLRRERWSGVYIPKGIYQNFVKFGLKSGLVHLSVLESCGRAISWHLGFCYKNRFYYYVPVFSFDMATYSPGKVHLSMLIEEAMQQGLEIFDFLLGAEEYKMKWINASVDIYGYEDNAKEIVAKIRSVTCNIFQSAAALKRRLKVL